MASFPLIVSDWNCNKEDEHLKEEIPWESTGIKCLQDLQKGRKVYFAHRPFSPPSSSIRALLNYYQIPQDRALMDMPWKSSIGSSKYKMVPLIVLFPIDEEKLEGYQVNDSAAICRSLCPILTGRTATDEIGSMEDEIQVFRCVPSSVLTTLFEKSDGGPSFARHWSSPEGSTSFLGPIFKPLVLMITSSNMKKFRERDSSSFLEKMKWFIDATKSRNKIDNDEEGKILFWSANPSGTPGIVDIFLYGFLSCVLTVVKSNAKDDDENWMIKDMKEAGAWDWFQGVDKAYSEQSHEAVITDEMKKTVSKNTYWFG